MSVAELDVWEELAERVGASPFVRPAWVSAWWSAFGRGALELVTVRRADGRLAALLPLERRRGALGSPTNWHTPEFGLVAESDEAARALVELLLARRSRRVALSSLAPEQAELVARAAERSGARVIRRTARRSPYVRIEGDWESYLVSLGKNLRGDLRRRRRLLARRGALALEIATGAGPGRSLDDLLDEGFAVEASSWKRARGTAVRARPAERRFYGEVARWAAERGWLRLCFLRLDGRPLAFDFALEHAGVHSLLKLGYDAEYAALSPGKVLRAEMLARAHREGLRSYEMLGEPDPWKLLWTRATRPREVVQVFRASPLGLCDWSLHRYGRPLAKWVRDRSRGPAHGARERSASAPAGAASEA